MTDCGQLQGKLGAAPAANRPGSGIDHVLVPLPSYSVSESLSHYGDHVAALEHRYLNALQFDPLTKVGTVLHILSGLEMNGRFGVTAIARTPAAADAMYEAVRHAVQRLADRRATDREPSPAWPQAATDGG